MASYPPVVTQRRMNVDAGKLWAGGLATAFVAAMIAIAGIVIARTVFDVRPVAPTRVGDWTEVSITWYALGAAFAAVATTALMQVLIRFTPRPMRFYGWVVSLATLVAVTIPFGSGASTSAMLATAALNLVLGVAIGSLVAGSARSAMRTAALRSGAPGPYGSA